MKGVLALLALAGLTAGCRESVEARFIYYPSRELTTDPSAVGLAFRDVAFAAADGVKLHGWLIPGRSPTTLLYSHGNGGNMAGRVTIARMLVDRLGVGVFMYDYRGYGRSEGAPSEAGLVSDALGARAALELAEGPEGPAPAVAVARARLELDEGDAKAATATLAPWLNGSATTPSLALLVEAWLLDALAARALGDPERGFRSLERALHLAEREGFRLPFVSGRGPLLELLSAHLDSQTAHRQLIAKLLETRRPAPEPAPPASAPEDGGLIESLSERERIVLRYLTSPLSNVEIAAELYVSVNTVKTHIKSIYRKLDTTGRREAVRRARELKLL